MKNANSIKTQVKETITYIMEHEFALLIITTTVAVINAVAYALGYFTI